ncbi:hypothetical protein L0244_33365 [bacterium]|nr:hypothetical protein [bacterium]
MYRLITFVLVFVFTCFHSAVFSTDAKNKIPKLQKKYFNRAVLYPNNPSLTAEGVPQAVVSANNVSLSARATRGDRYLYFQIDIENKSDHNFLWSSSHYQLTSDQNFSLAGVAPYFAATELAQALDMPPPPPPPAPVITTVESTTTGSVDSSGNVTAHTTSTATTQEDPSYQAGYAIGSALGGLLVRGRINKEKDFIDELAAYGHPNFVVGPNGRQRFYLCFRQVKSNFYDLILAEPFSQSIRFFKDKPKNYAISAQKPIQ